MNRLSCVLIAWMIAVCVPIIAVAWLLAGPIEAARAAVAAVLCLLPNVFTLSRLNRQESQGSWWLQVLCLGTMSRFVAAFGLGFAFYCLFPALEGRSYWLWLLVFYLVSLFLLIFLLVRLPPLPTLTEKSYKSSDS